MKKFFLRSMTCLIALSFLGCDESKPSGPQPAAGNDPPKYGAAGGSKLGKKLGGGASSGPKSVNDKTAVEP
jgi:hypothetical protein